MTMASRAFAFDFLDHHFEADANGFLDVTRMWHVAGSPPDKTFSHWQHTDEGTSFTETIASIVDTPATRLVVRDDSGHTRALWNLGVSYGMFLSPEFNRLFKAAIAKTIRERNTPDNVIGKAIALWRQDGKDWDWIEQRLSGVINPK